MDPRTATTANKEIAKSYLFNIFAGNKITRIRECTCECETTGSNKYRIYNSRKASTQHTIVVWLITRSQMRNSSCIGCAGFGSTSHHFTYMTEILLEPRNGFFRIVCSMISHRSRPNKVLLAFDLIGIQVVADCFSTRTLSNYLHPFQVLDSWYGSTPMKAIRVFPQFCPVGREHPHFYLINKIAVRAFGSLFPAYVQKSYFYSSAFRFAPS